MDRNLTALKPTLVWKHFAEIVRIPRPSSHEERIRRYVLDFARSRGLEATEDAAHNICVRPDDDCLRRLPPRVYCRLKKLAKGDYDSDYVATDDDNNDDNNKDNNGSNDGNN